MSPPNSKTTLQKLSHLILAALRVYWDIFIWPPFMVFTILFCAIAIVAAGLDLAHGAPKFWQDVLVIPVAASTLFIRRFRIFCWALFGVFFTWAVILGLALVAIFGMHINPTDPIIHGVLVVLLCLPPLIITVCVDLALHRMRPNQAMQRTADRPYA